MCFNDKDQFSCIFFWGGGGVHSHVIPIVYWKHHFGYN